MLTGLAGYLCEIAIGQSGVSVRYAMDHQLTEEVELRLGISIILYVPLNGGSGKNVTGYIYDQHGDDLKSDTVELEQMISTKKGKIKSALGLNGF